MPSEASFRIDSYVDDNRLHIKADLPGVEPKDVEIALDGNRLTVKGERKAEHEDKNSRILPSRAFIRIVCPVVYFAEGHRCGEDRSECQERHARSRGTIPGRGQAETYSNRCET